MLLPLSAIPIFNLFWHKVLDTYELCNISGSNSYRKNNNCENPTVYSKSPSSVP